MLLVKMMENPGGRWLRQALITTREPVWQYLKVTMQLQPREPLFRCRGGTIRPVHCISTARLILESLFNGRKVAQCCFTM